MKIILNYRTTKQGMQQQRLENLATKIGVEYRQKDIHYTPFQLSNGVCDYKIRNGITIRDLPTSPALVLECVNNKVQKLEL